MNAKVTFFIIVTEPAREDLSLCLESLFDQPLSQQSFEFIVVDMTRQSGSAQFLFETFPQVIYCQENILMSLTGAIKKYAYLITGTHVVFFSQPLALFQDAIKRIFEWKNQDIVIVQSRSGSTRAPARLQRTIPYGYYPCCVISKHYLDQILDNVKGHSLSALIRSKKRDVVIMSDMYLPARPALLPLCITVGDRFALSRWSRWLYYIWLNHKHVSLPMRHALYQMIKS